MKYLLLLITFVLVTDWSQVTLFVVALLSPGVKKTRLKDKRMLKIVKEKAGLKLNHIIIIESDKMHGGMSGVPGKPIMMMSSTLLKKLNKDEQEYVLLHEAAHFKYNHPIIVGISQIALIALGIYTLQFVGLAISVIIGVVFGLVFIQIARVTERQAENFAASKMNSPKAMISAVNKFEKSWSKMSFARLRKFLSWNISYDEKRSIATKHINQKSP